MGALDRGELEAAVDELRAFIARFDDEDVPRGSPLARTLEHAKKAVRAVDEVKTRELRPVYPRSSMTR